MTDAKLVLSKAVFLIYASDVNPIRLKWSLMSSCGKYFVIQSAGVDLSQKLSHLRHLPKAKDASLKVPHLAYASLAGERLSCTGVR